MSITVVQHASATASYTAGTTATLSPAFAGATAANNALFACITLFEDPTNQLVISTVTTNGAVENWLAVANIGGGATDGEQFAIWVNKLTAGSQTVVDINFSFGYTATTSSSVCALADIYEVAGIANPSLDKGSVATSGASGVTAWDSGAGGTAVTSQASEIWLGMAALDPTATDTATTITGAAPWINATVLSSSVQSGGTGAANSFFVYQISGYQIVSATGSAKYSGTNSVSSYSKGIVTTFFQTNPNAVIGIPVGVVMTAPGGPVPLSSLGPQPGFAVASSNRDSLRRSPVVPISAPDTEHKHRRKRSEESSPTLL